MSGGWVVGGGVEAKDRVDYSLIISVHPQPPPTSFEAQSQQLKSLREHFRNSPRSTNHSTVQEVFRIIPHLKRERAYKIVEIKSFLILFGLFGPHRILEAFRNDVSSRNELSNFEIYNMGRFFHESMFLFNFFCRLKNEYIHVYYTSNNNNRKNNVLFSKRNKIKNPFKKIL